MILSNSTQNGLFVATMVLLTAVSATAQTNDVAWRSWMWQEELTAPRALGLGGAFVAIADDASAQFLNPAGLTTLTKTEIAVGGIARQSGTTPIRDQVKSRTGLGWIGGGGHVTRHFAIGGYLTQPHDRRATLVEAGPAGSNYTGYIETTVTDAGVAAAWEPHPKVSFGIRLNITHLRLEALSNDAAGDSAAGSAAAQDQIAGDAGILFRPTGKISVGASFTQGARWDADRNVRQGPDTVAAPGYQVSSPSRLAGGISYVVSPRLTLVGQVDYVLLARIHDTFQAVRGSFQREEYETKDGIEFRAGAEYSHPLSRASLQLRAGIYSQAPGSLRYTGTNAEEKVLFAGVERRTLFGAGASVLTRTIRFDVGALLGGERTLIAAGAAVRF